MSCSQLKYFYENHIMYNKEQVTRTTLGDKKLHTIPKVPEVIYKIGNKFAKNQAKKVHSIKVYFSL